MKTFSFIIKYNHPVHLQKLYTMENIPWSVRPECGHDTAWNDGIGAFVTNYKSSRMWKRTRASHQLTNGNH